MSGCLSVCNLVYCDETTNATNIPFGRNVATKISPGKCSVLNIGTIQFPNDYIMGGINLPTVDHVTDQGFEIDSKLSFKQYISL
jgi:hypothetical protein